MIPTWEDGGIEWTVNGTRGLALLARPTDAVTWKAADETGHGAGTEARNQLLLRRIRSDEGFLRSALRSARRRSVREKGSAPFWGHLAGMFQQDERTARALCKRFGFHPETGEESP